MSKLLIILGIYTLFILCKVNCQTSQTSTDDESTATCRNNGTRRFCLSNQVVSSFDEAERFCENLQGSVVASLSNRTSRQFFRNVLIQKRTHRYYINLRKENNVWVYGDGMHRNTPRDIYGRGHSCATFDDSKFTQQAPCDGIFRVVCERNISDPCEFSPCMNNGICTSNRTTFQCQCVDGFLGVLCENYIPRIEAHTNTVLSVDPGTNRNITCVASGNPTPTVRWFKVRGNIRSNPSQISSSTGNQNSTILSLMNIRPSDGGFYVCNASNNEGFNFLNVTLRVSPHILVDQTTYVLRVGSRVIIHCRVTAFPELTYIRWVKNGNHLTQNGSLIFNRVQASNGGDYMCTANNVAGTNNVRVTIRVIPTITLSTRSLSLQKGLDGSVECTSSGYPVPDINFYRQDGGQLSERVSTSNSMNENESNTFRTITFYTIQASDGGVYICNASNAAGFILKNFTVSVAPSLNLQPRNMLTLNPFGSGQVNCSASGFPPPRIVWSREDGKRFSDRVQITRPSVAENNNPHQFSILRFNEITSQDGGTYTCTASNSAGRNAYNSLTLQVRPSARITNARYIFEQHTSGSIECIATGYPKPTIIWTKGGLQLGSSSNFSFPRITARNGGVYLCNAANDVGSSNASTTVRVLPNIRISPSPLTITLDRSTDVTCTASGFPIPTITWYKKVEDSNRRQVINSNIVISTNQRSRTSRLSFIRVQYNQQGTYYCEATSFENRSRTLQVSVTVPMSLELSVKNPHTVIRNQVIPNITCTGSATPPIKLTWMRNGRRLGSSGSVYQVVLNSNSTKSVAVLVLNNIEFEDAGEYICRLGEGVSQQVERTRIKVEGPPVEASNQHVVRILPNATEASFTCAFDGRPTPSLTWSFPENVELPGNSQFMKSEVPNSQSYRSSSKLTVYGTRCKGTFLKRFICSAQNTYANDGVESSRFILDFDTSSLTVSDSTMTCEKAHEFCQSRNMTLAVIPTRRLLTSIYDQYEETYPRNYFWISNISVKYLSKEFNQFANRSCIGVRRGLKTSSSRHLSTTQRASRSVCEKRERIQPTNIRSPTSQQSICNGTFLHVRWKPLPGSRSFKHQIFVNGSIKHEVEPGLNSTSITGLTPRTTYNIQVKPSFDGCQLDQPIYPQIMKTGRGELIPPKILSFLYQNTSKNCMVSWETNHDEEIGMLLIRITEYLGNQLDSNNQTNQTVASIKVDSPNLYAFKTLPNSRYVIQMGVEPGSPCQDIISPQWSEVYADSCVTPISAPDSIHLSLHPPIYKKGKIFVTLESVNQRNGPISCIIVVLQKLVNGTFPPKIEDPLLLGSEKHNNKETHIAYVTPSFPGSIQLGLGDQSKTCCDVTKVGREADCSRDATSSRNKRAAENQIVGENNRLERGSDYSYYLISSTPTENGPLYTSSVPSPPFLSNSTGGPVSPNNDGTIIAIVVVLLILILLVVLFFILYRRRKSAKTNPDSVKDEVLMTSIINTQNEGNEEEPYVNFSRPRTSSSEFPEYNLSPEQILNVYRAKTQDENRLFRHEFKVTLLTEAKNLNIDTSISKLEENVAKNRFKNILPSNKDRVVLEKLSDQSQSDYINASFINGYNQDKKFIAAQGPKKTTCADFWRMIVQNQCSVIVMVTQTRESRVEKCTKYWPDAGEQVQHGLVLVDGISQISCGEFQITHLCATNTYDGKRLEVTHFQYLSWPDHGVPSTTTGFLRLYKAACVAHSDSKIPMVVHCSAGVGRTGTFIAFDILLNQISCENQINVFETILKLRAHRTEMVQSLDQYIYLHKLIAEVFHIGTTEVEVGEFFAYEEAQLKQSNKSSGIKEQLELLKVVPPSFTSTKAALKPINEPMNIDEILPYDKNLPFLSMKSSESELPYINASYIQAYSAHSYLIVAQNPIPQNIYLFWRSIIDHRIKCVIMIEDDEEPCDNYWGNMDHLVQFEDVSVRIKEELDCSTHIERKIEVYKEGETKPHHVNQAVIKGWGNHSTPSPNSVLQLVNILEQASSEAQVVREKKTFAFIHCRDGSTQSGTLCAIYNLIERVKSENVVDVFRAVKDVRDLRMGAVGSEEQFKFCYKVVAAFIQSFDLYANFK